MGDPLTFAHRARIAQLAMKHRLPTMHFYREAAEAGGLLSYWPDWHYIWRNAAKYIDKILKGAKPATIPVEQPAKYELVINPQDRQGRSASHFPNRCCCGRIK